MLFVSLSFWCLRYRFSSMPCLIRGLLQGLWPCHTSPGFPRFPLKSSGSLCDPKFLDSTYPQNQQHMDSTKFCHWSELTVPRPIWVMVKAVSECLASWTWGNESQGNNYLRGARQAERPQDSFLKRYCLESLWNIFAFMYLWAVSEISVSFWDLLKVSFVLVQSTWLLSMGTSNCTLLASPLHVLLFGKLQIFQIFLLWFSLLLILTINLAEIRYTHTWMLCCLEISSAT